jgi:hypothetical protein
MKAHRVTHLIAAVFGLAAWSTAGCADEAKSADAALPPAKTAAPTKAAPAVSGRTTTIPAATTPGPEVVRAQWNDIKDHTYERRAQFFAGLKDVEARVDKQIAELKAKRATMKGITDTREWDFEMRAMVAARAYLTSMGLELHKASRETWDQEKDKVGRAWVSTQDAYSKVRLSTTS